MQTAGDVIRKQKAVVNSLVAANISPSALVVAAEHEGTRGFRLALLKAWQILESHRLSEQ